MNFGWILLLRKKRCKCTTKIVKEYQRCFPIVSLCSLFAFLFPFENVLVRRRYGGQGSSIHPSHQEDITGRPHALACPHHNLLREQKSVRDLTPEKNILNNSRRKGTASRRFYKSVTGIKLSPHEKVRMRSCPHKDVGNHASVHHQTLRGEVKGSERRRGSEKIQRIIHTLGNLSEMAACTDVWTDDNGCLKTLNGLLRACTSGIL